MTSITLCTLNARYIHASLGLRYLLANMGDLRSRTRLLEFTLEHRPADIVEQLLDDATDSDRQRTQPLIIGFGIYIWNVAATTQVVQLLKTIRPDCTVVIGGPEISFETHAQPIAELADYVLTGQADLSFAELCREISAGTASCKFVSSLPLDLKQLASPYPCYSDTDLQTRIVYVEASRGCPFKCEFCLSSLDKNAVPFDLPRFIADIEQLIQRGARQFKFVDRTFNLKADTGREILEFFLQHIDLGLFLHFELIPDRLPAALRNLLPAFPAGSLQFEIGIQSFNPKVQKLINRKQQHEKTCANLRWLRANSTAHIHADLIFGLPGETLDSFGAGFDELYALGPQEIQVGLLKRLRGTPINRHTEVYDMRYMLHAPYRVLSTRDVSFVDMQRMVRFARYWDLIGNSGRFPAALPILLADSPFARFLAFTDWLYASSTQTHKISLPRLFEFLLAGLQELQFADAATIRAALTTDHHHNRLKGQPRWRNSAPIDHCQDHPGPATATLLPTAHNRRQRRHLLEPNHP